MPTLTAEQVKTIQAKIAAESVIAPETPMVTLNPTMLAAMRPAFELMAKDADAATRVVGERVLTAHNSVLSGAPQYNVVPVALTPGVQKYVVKQLAISGVDQSPQSPAARLARTIAAKLQLTA